MPTFKRTNKAPTKLSAEVLVVGVFRGENGKPRLTDEAKAVDKALKGAVDEHLSRVLLRNLPGQTQLRYEGQLGAPLLIPSVGRVASKSVLVVGLGEEEKFGHGAIRRAAGAAARQAAGCRTVALALPTDVPGGAQAAVEGYLLGGYRFGRYKTDAGPSETRQVLLTGKARGEEISRGEILAEATNWARDLVNEPSGNRGPAGFAEHVAERAKKAGVSVEIFDEKTLARRGLNGILGVGKGSVNPPRLVILRYRVRGAKRFVGAVGKGITFDSGGLSLKTAEGMETMKIDCSGAAAVAAAMTALPALGPRINVVAALPLAENMPSGTAIKPGDVITHYGGRSSEVVNTDAEGRLVLADALAWMAEQAPDAIIDFATLTGGMMVALGHKVAGFFATRPELAEELRSSAERTGERIWEMPLLEDLRGEIDSEVADLKNTGGRYGSPIFGALFLKDFVGDVPWAHVDIAGPARSEREEHHIPVGATGVGTRFLVDWIEQRAQGR